MENLTTFMNMRTDQGFKKFYEQLVNKMDKPEKDSEAYKASRYRDFFDASATDSSVAGDAVPYSQSPARLEAIEAGIRYAAYEAYNEGFTKGYAESIAEGVYAEKMTTARKMLGYNIDIDVIKAVTGLTDEEISKL